MTDRYAELRAALDDFDSGSLDGRDWINLADPYTIRALLADYKEASARAFYETSVAQAAIEQVKTLETERDRLCGALIDATAHLAGAATAYRQHASRSRGVSPRATADAFFTTRVNDFDGAVERAKRALGEWDE